MTIVTAKPPKQHPRPKSQPAALIGPAIVTTRKQGSKFPAELPDDPEADERVKAWFARNVRPLGS